MNLVRHERGLEDTVKPWPLCLSATLAYLIVYPANKITKAKAHFFFFRSTESVLSPFLLRL